jgi:hypothetical protein
MDAIEEQPLKAPSPRLVMPAGRAIDVNEEQLQNAPSPRLVSPLGSSIDVIEEQPQKVYSVAAREVELGHLDEVARE